MKAISEETTVAIQGYGSVGANAARLLDKWGQRSSQSAT